MPETIIHNIINVERLHRTEIVAELKSKITEVGLRGTQGPSGDKGDKGDSGYTFIPSLNNGILAWTNNGGLTNPADYDFMDSVKDAIDDAIDDACIGTITNKQINDLFFT